MRGDRSAGLSIKLADDGRLFLHCFAGCTAETIVAAVGLTMADLFPPRIDKPDTGKHTITRAMHDAVQSELWLLLVAAGQLQRGEPLAPADCDRVKQAQARVNRYWRAAL